MIVAPLLVSICTLLADPTTTSPGDQRPVAYVGARVIRIAGTEIDNGVLVVRAGKIVAVGPADQVQIPEGAERRDVTGKVIMPGLVDTHSHIGGPSGGDASGAIQPDCRACDAINVRDAGVQKAQAGGITTVNVMPGSGHLLSGQTIYLKLRDVPSPTIDDLAYRNADGSYAGGMKMANGTNSIRAAPFPGTRAKSAALVREQYVKAQEYRDKIKRANGDPEKMPPRDLAMEGLVEVLEGKRVVHHHTHRHDDILTVLRLSKEFGFKVVLHHVTDGYKVADQISAAGVPCSIIVIDSPGGKPETKDLSFSNGAILEKAGVLVAFHTDDSITDSRLFLRSAALGVRGGMSRKGALEAMTINGARMLDLDKRVGTLEPGKDADFIILSGDPLSVYAHVMQTYVEGNKVFERDDPKDHLLAVGGFGASKDQTFHLDCFDDGDEK